MPIDFVYPNVSQLNRRGKRGGLDERFRLAVLYGCRYVEVPADFIKNKSEEQLTELRSGSFLNEDAIQVLYEPTSSKNRLDYILHTEWRDGPFIKWREPDWRKRLADMLLNLSQYLGGAPSHIEIHPGIGNNFENLASGCRELLENFEDKFSRKPIILLENRTRQFIATGIHLQNFWNYIIRHHSDLKSLVGIVLDIQQLFTASENQHTIFLRELAEIPQESIHGLHIHRRHGPPNLQDPIPWQQVFNQLQGIFPRSFVNPEVHHRNQVPKTIKFCRERFNELRRG